MLSGLVHYIPTARSTRQEYEDYNLLSQHEEHEMAQHDSNTSRKRIYS